MTEYYIGQIFNEMYPKDASDWCGDNNACIDEIEPLNNVRRFQIRQSISPTPTPVDIDSLTMTALDFVNFLKSNGLTDANIEEYLKTHLEVKHQLEFCQNVYCGVARALMPITWEGVTITEEMVVQAFKDKHGIND